MAFLVIFSFFWGQETKRALTHRDYDSWHSIQSPQISRNGKFIAYAYLAQDGDSEIVVRNLTSGTEWRAPRGDRPPALPPDDSIPNVAELIAANARLVRPAFTADSRFVIFSIEPTKAELNKRVPFVSVTKFTAKATVLMTKAATIQLLQHRKGGRRWPPSAFLSSPP